MTLDAHCVATGLWVGGYPGSSVTLRHSFDVLVLCAEELQGVDTDIEVLRVPFDDTSAKQPPLSQLLEMAQRINRRRLAGKRVLVTCAAGVNRSAFVAALALVLEGRSAKAVIRRIRARRQPPVGGHALRNALFVALLKQVAERRAA